MNHYLETNNQDKIDEQFSFLLSNHLQGILYPLMIYLNSRYDRSSCLEEEHEFKTSTFLQDQLLEYAIYSDDDEPFTIYKAALFMFCDRDEDRFSEIMQQFDTKSDINREKLLR